MEDDVLGTARVLGHVEAETCEVCGRVVERGKLERKDLDRGDVAGPVEGVRVCPAGKQAFDSEDALVIAEALSNLDEGEA
jgi:hypothetical protein